MSKRARRLAKKNELRSVHDAIGASLGKSAAAAKDAAAAKEAPPKAGANRDSINK
jgi:hypothetical protein